IIELLAGWRFEHDGELDPAAGDLGDGALGSVREVVDRYGCRPQRNPGQPVRRRLDDDQVLSIDDRAARLAQAGGDRGDLAGGRVVPADRVVVRVGNGYRAVRQGSDAQRVLQ